MLDKKEKIDSHLGLKVRKSSKQKKREEQLCSSEKQQARHEQQHQQIVDAWKEEQALQKKREPSVTMLHAAGAAAVRLKFVQFAVVLHPLQHQRPMVAYEQQQELQQLCYDWTSLHVKCPESNGQMTAAQDIPFLRAVQKWFEA
jgi:hypothetical protein